MEFIRQYLDISVFAVLGIMSFLALAYTIERAISFSRIKVERYPQLELLKLDLNKGLAVIATIASNAPYVGLLGTVFGIMITFYDIGQSGQIDTNSVMVGLALALKATALGLLVAIPAMVFYNMLVAKAERIISFWKLAHGVTDHN